LIEKQQIDYQHWLSWWCDAGWSRYCVICEKLRSYYERWYQFFYRHVFCAFSKPRYNLGQCQCLLGRLC
jgi:hypothetical protein